MTKVNRQKVFDKYSGHCAYCGKKIDIKDMQVDHIIPVCLNGNDDIANTNPSCRRCNHYKRAESLEYYRELINTIHERLQDIYIYKVALDYGLIVEKPFSNKFYFEYKLEEQEK